MAKKKIEPRDIKKRIKELKIELLKQPTKRKTIKKEIARMLTIAKLNESKESSDSGGKK